MLFYIYICGFFKLSKKNFIEIKEIKRYKKKIIVSNDSLKEKLIRYRDMIGLINELERASFLGYQIFHSKRRVERGRRRLDEEKN